MPSHGLKIETVDAHVGGQPLRLVVSGFPEPRGVTMLEKCRYAAEHLNHLRGALLLEPRGHPDMYACLLTGPQRHTSHFGTLFFHRSGICPMSGHGIIATATMVIESGLVEMKAPETLLKFDTPAGLVRAYAKIEDGRVRRVFFENVPSFVYAMDRMVQVPGLGVVPVDVAYGGEFYAYVNAPQLNLALEPENLGEITRLGTLIAEAVEQQIPVQHPTEDLLGLFSGVVFVAHPARKRENQAHSRLVCVYSDGSVDRSASGTALSGRLALLQRRGETELGDPHVVEGLLGSQLTARTARDAVTVGRHTAIVAEIEGTAWITARQTFFIDPEDPLKEGFLL